jgi:hypothetical protein
LKKNDCRQDEKKTEQAFRAGHREILQFAIEVQPVAEAAIIALSLALGKRIATYPLRLARTRAALRMGPKYFIRFDSQSLG